MTSLLSVASTAVKSLSAVTFLRWERVTDAMFGRYFLFWNSASHFYLEVTVASKWKKWYCDPNASNTRRPKLVHWISSVFLFLTMDANRKLLRRLRVEARATHVRCQNGVTRTKLCVWLITARAVNPWGRLNGALRWLVQILPEDFVFSQWQSPCNVRADRALMETRKRNNPTTIRIFQACERD